MPRDQGEREDSGPLALEGSPDEVVGMRDAVSRTFRQPDGRYATYVFAEPVNFRASDRRWYPIENRLVATGRAGFAVENKANRYSAFIPSSLRGGVVRFQVAGDWATFGLRGVSTSARALRVEASRAAFDETAPGVSVEYEARSDGLKETFTLAGPEAPNTFVFDLRTSAGITPRETGAGGVEFVDPAGAVVFGFSPPFMADSSGSEDGFSSAVSLTLGGEAPAWTLTLAADREWLRDPARVWPIVIDPTVKLGDELDCFIRGGGYASTNYCSAEHVTVGYESTKRRGLLRFDLSSIPAGRTILDAELWLDCVYADSSTLANIDIHRVTSNWGIAATWQKKTANTNWTTPGGDFGSLAWASRNTNCSTFGFKKFEDPDLVGLVQHWHNGTYQNHGVLLKQRSETTDQFVRFTSTDTSDDSKWPYLRVEYESNGIPAPPVLVEPAEGAVEPLEDLLLTFDVAPFRWLHAEIATSPLFDEGAIVCDSGWIETGSVAEHTWDATGCGILTPATRYWWRGRVADGDPTLGASAAALSPWSDPLNFDGGEELEDPEVTAIAIEHLVEEFGFSVSAAAQELVRQERTTLAQVELEEALGPYFGGLWFQPDEGAVKLAVVTPGDIPEAQKVAEAYGLADDMEILHVDSSYDDLVVTADAMIDSLEELDEDQPSSVSIDEPANSVTVLVSDELTPAALHDIEEIADQQPVGVQVEVAAAETLDAGEPALCSVPYCDRPLRGGVRIHRGGNSCTAGFMVATRGTNQLAVMTTGHCLSPGESWYSYDAARQEERTIGAAARVHNGPYDAGLIMVESGSYWREQPWRGWVLRPPRPGLPANHKYFIKGARRALGNKVVCRTSARVLENGNYASCGTVVDPHTTQQFTGANLRNLAKVKTCNHAPRGSSGGPWYRHHYAYGLHVGPADERSDCFQWYQKIKVALDATDSYLMIE